MKLPSIDISGSAASLVSPDAKVTTLPCSGVQVTIDQRWANYGPRKVFMRPDDSFLGVQPVEKTVCSKSITPKWLRFYRSKATLKLMQAWWLLEIHRFSSKCFKTEFLRLNFHWCTCRLIVFRTIVFGVFRKRHRMFFRAINNKQVWTLLVICKQ